MPITPLYMTQHDRRPYYYVTVKDASGNLIDLTGYTIRCTMKALGGSTPKIDRRTTGVTLADQSSNKGLFYLNWQIGDTNTVGTYNIEFELTPSADSDKFTFPNPEHGPAQVIISAGQDDQ